MGAERAEEKSNEILVSVCLSELTLQTKMFCLFLFVKFIHSFIFRSVVSGICKQDA